MLSHFFSFVFCFHPKEVWPSLKEREQHKCEETPLQNKNFGINHFRYVSFFFHLQSRPQNVPQWTLVCRKLVSRTEAPFWTYLKRITSAFLGGFNLAKHSIGFVFFNGLFAHVRRTWSGKWLCWVYRVLVLSPENCFQAWFDSQRPSTPPCGFS